MAAAASSFLLIGCQPDGAPTLSTAAVIAAVGAALARGSREEFGALFSGEARIVADRLWRTWHDVCATASITGEGATMQVTWRLPQERTESVDRLTVSSVDGRVTALAAPSLPAPPWLDEQMVGSAAGAATVLAGASHSAELSHAWLTSAQQAARIVSDASLGPAAASWDGVLRIVLPGQHATFLRLTGLSADVADATQAATILTAPGSVPRVIVNPSWATELSTSARLPLLVHEGVHEAVVSAVASAPLWVTEGIAESVAHQADPGTRRTNRDLARTASPPTALPTAAELNGPDAVRAYALAAVAVEATATRWGRPALMRWLADWGAADRPSDAELTSTYRRAWAALT